MLQDLSSKGSEISDHNSGGADIFSLFTGRDRVFGPKKSGAEIFCD